MYKNWKNNPIQERYVSVVISLVLALIVIGINAATKGSGFEWYNWVELLSRIVIFAPIVIHILWVVINNQKIAQSNLNLTSNNSSYFRDLGGFLNNLKQSNDRDNLLKEIIAISRTIDNKGMFEMKSRRKYFDLYIHFLTFLIKDFHEQLKSDKNGTLTFKTKKHDRFEKIWLFSIECVRTEFFAINYPQRHSFGRKNDAKVIELQENKVNELKQIGKGQFQRIFVYDSGDLEDIKNLYNTACKQFDAGIQVKLIEKPLYDFTFYDYIRIIESPDFCLINNQFLVIFKGNEQGEKTECEITYETDKLQAAQELTKFINEHDNCREFKHEVYTDLAEFVKNLYNPTKKERDIKYKTIDDLNNIKAIASEGDIDKTILELDKFVKSKFPEIENRVIEQSAKWQSFKKERVSGLYDVTEIFRIRGEIIWALLEIIRDIEKKGD